jgi:hypothetical protein
LRTDPSFLTQEDILEKKAATWAAFFAIKFKLYSSRASLLSDPW